MIYVPYAAILAAFILIHFPRSVVGKEMHKLGGYDNHDPRGQQARLDGLGKRALGAHQNGFEAFAPFAVAVLMCGQRGVKLELVAALSIAFVVLRTIYVFAYLNDKPMFRSSMWTLSALSTVALMVLAIVGVT